jgi:hypothetical protein
MIYNSFISILVDGWYSRGTRRRLILALSSIAYFKSTRQCSKIPAIVVANHSASMKSIHSQGNNHCSMAPKHKNPPNQLSDFSLQPSTFNLQPSVHTEHWIKAF